MTREGIVFYRSFYESLKNLPAEDFKKCACAILDYGLDGEEPQELGGAVGVVFPLIKPQIDANNVKYLNGCKGGEFGYLGGAPKGNQNARKQPQTTPKQPQNNPETTRKEKEKDKDKEKDKEKDKDLKRENIKEKKITRFHVFNESHYDFDALERESGIK